MAETAIQPPGPGNAAELTIADMRRRIDMVDEAIIQLWQERTSISRRIGSIRLETGGTRVVLSREQQVIERFHAGLGVDGTTIALLVLRAGRGPL